EASIITVIVAVSVLPSYSTAEMPIWSVNAFICIPFLAPWFPHEAAGVSRARPLSAERTGHRCWAPKKALRYTSSFSIGQRREAGYGEERHYSRIRAFGVRTGTAAPELPVARSAPPSLTKHQQDTPSPCGRARRRPRQIRRVPPHRVADMRTCARSGTA